MTLVFLAVAAFFLLLFIYPYVIYPFVLRYISTRKSDVDISSQTTPSGALLFCAYNEEASLPAKLENIRAIKQQYPDLQILAYSDCSSDATNELLKQASDVLMPIIGTQRLGKVLGMQTLVAASTADVLIFSDANVIVEPDSVQTLLNYFRDSSIGSVGCTLLYDQDRDESLSDTARVGGLYWRLEEYIKQQESRCGSMMGADGALFARRREDYPELPGDLVDDMAASIAVLFQGLRCVSASDVIGYEQSVQSSSEEFKRKKRIACGSYSTYRFLRPQIEKLNTLDRFKFLSHKVLRWWGAAHLLAALIAFLLAAISANLLLPAAILLAVGASVFFIGNKIKFGPISSLWEILAAVLATGLGVMESRRGEKYQTWTPAQSR